MPKHHHTPGEMRSIVKNPNNPAYAADVANRISLGHQSVPPSPAAPQPATNPPEPKK